MPFDQKPAASPAFLPLRMEGVRLGEGRRRPGAALDSGGGDAAGGDTALLNGLDLEIAPGGPTVLMGPNGAGKSLTLRIIQGLLAPSAGRLTFAGRPAEESCFRRVALVFQRPVLLRRSVRANLDHALRAYGAARSARPARIAELLEMAGLAALAERPARVLSGGEQQRLALVRALAADPEILLLDEPSASLDPQATIAVEGLMRRASEAGVKLVLVTHDVGQARRMAAEVAFMHCGRVVEHAPAEAFFARPASSAGRAYLEGRIFV